ncbi:YadA-like family protein [Conchiformibius steedae]|uniref:YadA-like family protein n=1 Tax=Conchiformibius steedae TaxID=153493 RepID=UPI0026EC06CC|nr:YadA-like family protein [Conchiformibius steedae]
MKPDFKRSVLSLSVMSMLSATANAALNIDTEEQFSTVINEAKFGNLATNAATNARNTAILADTLKQLTFTDAGKDKAAVAAALKEMQYLSNGDSFKLYNTAGSVPGSTVKTEPRVLLGSGSSARNFNATPVTEMTFKTGTGKTEKVAVAGTTVDGVVMVGNDKESRRIDAVAAGIVSKDSRHAVNGSQLYALQSQLDKGTSIVGDDGNRVTLYSGGTTKVAGDNKNITTSGKDGTFTIALKDTVSVKNANISDGATIAGTVINNSGITNNNKQIKQIAEGTAGTDAVNLNQLNRTNANVSNLSAEVAKGWNAVTSASAGKVVHQGGASHNVKMGGQTTFDAGKNIELTHNAATGVISIATSQNPDFETVSLSKGGSSLTLGQKGGNTLVLGNPATAPVTIANVKAGVADNDAVNVKQLRDTVGNLTLPKNIVTFANDSHDLIVLENTTISNVKAGVNATDAVNVAQLTDTNNNVSNLTNVVNGHGQRLDKGATLTADDGKTAKITIGSGTTNVKGDNKNTVTSVDDKGALVIGLKDNLTVNGVNANTANIGGTVINNQTLNNGGKTITNVKAGENATDAVNLAQLQAAQFKAGQGWNLNATASAGKLTVVGDDAVQKVKAGGTATIDAGKNIALVHDTKTGVLSIATSDTPDFKSVSLNNGNSSVHLTTVNNTLKVSGQNGAPVVISNVKAGVNVTDAVNVGQLNEVKGRLDKGATLTADDGKTAKITIGSGTTNIRGDKKNTVTSVDDSGALVIGLTDNLTVNSVNATTANIGGTVINETYVDNGGKTITNVAPAVLSDDSTDVVIGSQLYQTNKHVQALSNRVDGFDRRIDQNTGGIAAAAALDIEYVEQKAGQSVMGVGVGHFNGKTAIGIGTNFLSENGKHKFNIGAAAAVQKRTRPLIKASWSMAF